MFYVFPIISSFSIFLLLLYFGVPESSILVWVRGHCNGILMWNMANRALGMDCPTHKYLFSLGAISHPHHEMYVCMIFYAYKPP